MGKEDCATCDGCDADCCKYLAMEIDTPEDLDDFENIKWYVAHKNVNVYIEEDGTWNIEFITPCEHLDSEWKCGIYERRPQICREYEHDECTFHNEYNEQHSMKSIEDVERYVEDVFKKGLHVIPDEDEEEEDSEDEEEEDSEDEEEEDSEEDEVEDYEDEEELDGEDKI